MGDRAIHTYSIVARCAHSGELGAAVASAVPAVGAICLYGRADVGCVSTQSWVNPYLAVAALDRMADGQAAEAALAAALEADTAAAFRQIGAIGRSGAGAAHTGSQCTPWAGQREAADHAVQGNMLTGPEVIDALVAGFDGHDGALPERLLAGLRAADRAGGDRRGRQSAALLVVREDAGYGGLNDRYIDLRVDDDGDPVSRLQDLLRLQRLYFERPADDEVVAIEGEVAERLLRVLRAAGEDPGDAWGERGEAALRALAGVENVEERMVSPGRIDPVVLAHLEGRYPG
jgi:uncharacterized Ntn-hydrolase superfamily protein